MKMINIINLKNKKAVSLMVSYVILVAIVISLSIAVFSWLRIVANIKPTANCEEGTSIVIDDYLCTGSGLELILKNNGRFSVDGFVMTVGGNPDRVPLTHLVALIGDADNEQELLLREVIFSPRLSPEDGSNKRTMKFDDSALRSDGKKGDIDFEFIRNLRLQPYIYDDEARTVFCEQSVITQDFGPIDCKISGGPLGGIPSSIPGGENMVHYWPFDGDFNDYDDVNNAVFTGGTTDPSVSFTTGFKDQAIEFGGGSEILASNDIFIAENSWPNDFITISFWLKSTVGGNILEKKDPGGVNNQQGIMLIGDIVGIGFWAGGNDGSYLRHDFDYLGEWYHITLTAENSGIRKIYINGILVEENNAGTYGLNGITNHLRIGRVPFEGLIDELRVWNRVLSADDVLDLYRFETD